MLARKSLKNFHHMEYVDTLTDTEAMAVYG
jgi:hypothetical protein